MPLQTRAENILYAAEGCPARRRWRSGGGGVQAPATSDPGLLAAGAVDVPCLLVWAPQLKPQAHGQIRSGPRPL